MSSKYHLHRSSVKEKSVRTFQYIYLCVFEVETLNYAHACTACIIYARNDYATGGGKSKKKPETINKKDNREKKCSEISLIIISGGGPHCGGCGLRRRRPETTLSGAGMRGISVRPSLIVYNLLLAQHSPITYTTYYIRIYTH